MVLRSYILTTSGGRILSRFVRHGEIKPGDRFAQLISTAMEHKNPSFVVDVNQKSLWIQRKPWLKWWTLWTFQDAPSEIVAHGAEKMIEFYPWPACITSPDGLVLRVNASFARLLGMDSTSLQDRPFIDLFAETPIFEKDFQSQIYRLKGAQDGAVCVSISHIVHTENSAVFFFFPAFLQKPGAGLGDIAFLREMPLPAALLDENGGIQEANALCQEQLMMTPIATLAQWVEEKDRYAFAQLLRRLRKMHEGMGSISVRLREPNAKSAFIFLKYIPGHDEHASGHFFSIFAMDDHLLPMKEADPQKMQLLGQLASGIVHDFNNLLTGILGFCDLLLQRHQPEEMSFQDIQQIKQSAMRAARLIQKLLSFSKDTDSGNTPICLKQCLHDLFPLIHRMVGPKILVNIEDSSEENYVMDGDLSQLEQIILNLVINGRDAMDQGGVLTVSLRTVTFTETYPVIKGVLLPKTYVVMDIKDTGMGIDSKNVERIFDPFFSTKDPGQGTGLGLSNVLQIMDQANGGITVDTALGVGTTLSLYFPACADPSVIHVGQVSQTPPKMNTAKTIRILLVEDEDPVRLFAARALREKGHDVIEARDGVQAMTFLEKQTTIHVMVTDVMMPGIDGPTLASSVRKLMPNTKILFVSGYPEESVRMHLKDNLDQIYFLPKPFALDDLVNKIQDMVQPVAA
jgi:two-component system cell cycle sensor histidine kinase/response regulator CckA